MDLEPAVNKPEKHVSAASSSSATSGGPALRALLIDLVLQGVAKNSSVRDLFNLRATNTVWSTSFIPAALTRSHDPIRLMKNHHEGYEGSGCPHPMDDFTQLMRTSQQIPFGRYEVYDYTFLVDDHGGYQKSLANFLSVCGQAILSIKFSCDQWKQGGSANVDKIRTTVFELAPRLDDLHICLEVVLCFFYFLPPSWNEVIDGRAAARSVPHLKKLRLSWSVSGLNEKQLQNFLFYTLIDELFRHATGLEELHLSMRYSDCSGTVRVLQALRDYAPALSKLKKMTLQDAKEMDLQLIELLQQMATRGQNFLRLEVFDLTIKYTYADPDSNLDIIHSFLGTQSGTLRLLRVNLDALDGLIVARFPASRFAIWIPHMHNLRTLILTGLGKFDLHFDGRTLGETFPSLAWLQLNWFLVVGEEGRADAIRVNQLPHPGLTRLTILASHTHFGRTPESDRRLEEISAGFPAVTRFEGSIPSVQVPKCIWITWPCLKFLRIEYVSQCEADTFLEVDEWLSGIPKSRFEALKAEPEYQKLLEPKTGGNSEEGVENSLRALRNLIETYKSHPGISQLKFLRSFTLILKPMHENLDPDCSISDIGGYFGLAMASTTIQHLVISCPKYSCPLLSAKCESRIRCALGPYADIKIGVE